MTKKTWMKSSMVIMTLLLAACNTNAKDSAEKASPNKVKVESTKSSKTTTGQEADIEKNGTYVGQVDNNSIEVEVDGESIVLRLTDQVRDSVDSIKDNSTVTVFYTKNDNGQYVLKNIKALETGEEAPSETKTLQYEVDGNAVSKEATLTKSEQDYYFYKLDDFDFTAEEPHKDLLFVQESPETFVRIEPLSANASLDDLKKWANDELKAVGDVKEVNGQEVTGGAVKNPLLFITASKDSYQKYIAIEELESGDKVKFTINLPKSDKIKAWEQEIWAMLSTLKMK